MENEDIVVFRNKWFIWYYIYMDDEFLILKIGV